MYKDNPNFTKPNNVNARIWRYMDFPKLLSLLYRGELFFCRADKLGDPFEGLCPERVIRIWEKKLGIQYAGGFYQRLREFTAVNCWHLNKNESNAMWKLYLRSNEGIAIQSTFNRLRNSFTDEEHDIFVGEVLYIDFDKYDDPNVAFVYPIMYKRKAFSGERELRAVIRKLPKRGFSLRSKHTFNDGIYVPVNLDTLIERILVAPTTPSWQLELIKSTTGEYGLNKEVQPSSLDDKPSLK